MTREELIEKYRHVNVDNNDWWEPVYEDMQTTLDDVGFRVDNFYWTGFWSQGDGACFEGHVYSTPKFFNAHFKQEDYPWIAQLVQMGGYLDISTKHTGRYYHEHSAGVDVTVDRFTEICTLDDLEQEVAVVWDAKLDPEVRPFEKDVAEILRGYMKELYRTLQKEYDYLTSDEAVGEYVDEFFQNELKDAA